MDLVLSLVGSVSGECDWMWWMQALLTSQCDSTLSIVSSAVSDITSKLTRTLKFKQPNQAQERSQWSELAARMEEGAKVSTSDD
ncbi:hypothetical protein ElyMa_002973600 [Elysia marginata]|uniref:Uncharacterized protein n=1 Tax=Elysia marginata TaxID=1093978 RepID=A0AAV4IB80_9GAST|nr:hypothetical protein ElyMa_002973600 [Elysia marginata]